MRSTLPPAAARRCRTRRAPLRAAAAGRSVSRGRARSRPSRAAPSPGRSARHRVAGVEQDRELDLLLRDAAPAQPKNRASAKAADTVRPSDVHDTLSLDHQATATEGSLSWRWRKIVKECHGARAVTAARACRVPRNGIGCPVDSTRQPALQPAVHLAFRFHVNFRALLPGDTPTSWASARTSRHPGHRADARRGERPGRARARHLGHREPLLARRGDAAPFPDLIEAIRRRVRENGDESR